MTGKPHQSRLVPYESEILDLRRHRPPMPYFQIADLLKEKYNRAVRQLAHLLEPLRIRPKQLRVGESNVRGYELDDFTNGFSRFAPT